MECAMNYESSTNTTRYIEMVNCVIVVNFPNHDGASHGEYWQSLHYRHFMCIIKVCFYWTVQWITKIQPRPYLTWRWWLVLWLQNFHNHAVPISKLWHSRVLSPVPSRWWMRCLILNLSYVLDCRGIWKFKHEHTFHRDGGSCAGGSLS